MVKNVCDIKLALYHDPHMSLISSQIALMSSSLKKPKNSLFFLDLISFLSG